MESQKEPLTLSIMINSTFCPGPNFMRGSPDRSVRTATCAMSFGGISSGFWNLRSRSRWGAASMFWCRQLYWRHFWKSSSVGQTTRATVRATVTAATLRGGMRRPGRKSQISSGVRETTMPVTNRGTSVMMKTDPAMKVGSLR